jgi:hypothetical protein
MCILVLVMTNVDNICQRFEDSCRLYFYMELAHKLWFLLIIFQYISPHRYLIITLREITLTECAIRMLGALVTHTSNSSGR